MGLAHADEFVSSSSSIFIIDRLFGLASHGDRVIGFGVQSIWGGGVFGVMKWGSGGSAIDGFERLGGEIGFS
ncbi:hypothetical protein Ddye_029250 [Dipteronia dyeriana]|uniref:Uncharacterized protein n=1 Tax=Dipteronia dyeriana TaxID=168575 RepID=A0AAD9WLM7_9ROSI|nr:hypothetical protein Ddye_029250 [Dipteronia dyeriana]